MTRPAIHPGQHLLVELEEMGMSQTQLAKQLGVPTNRISLIVNGQRGITADTALRLARWFGTTPEFWMNLQTAYDLRKAREEAGKEIERLVQPHVA